MNVPGDGRWRLGFLKMRFEKWVIWWIFDTFVG
nr:MAG TPA_asm: hypothetical protein [Caudoviricetes sp.]